MSNSRCFAIGITNRRRKPLTDVTCCAAIADTAVTGSDAPSGACANSTGAAPSSARPVCAKLKFIRACEGTKKKTKKKTFLS